MYLVFSELNQRSPGFIPVTTKLKIYFIGVILITVYLLDKTLNFRGHPKLHQGQHEMAKKVDSYTLPTKKDNVS